MEAIESYLNTEVLGNSVEKHFLALGVFALALLFLYLLEKIVIFRLRKLSKKSQTSVDDYIFNVIDATKLWFLFVLSLYIGSRFLKLPPKVNHYSYLVVIVLFLLQVAIWGKVAIDVWKKHYREKHLETDAAAVTTVGALSFLLKLVLYSIILFLVLENIGVNVTALVTGLGIGGIAVALAAQNILSDLFASLAIVLDKPFVIGDFIVVGDYMGSVEAIGVKTTRLRSISGEQIAMPNSDLMGSRIRNFKRMQQRRIAFSLGVTYQTSTEKLKKIPAIIQKIIGEQKLATFDRAHFKDFGDSSLNFDIVYYVLTSDYQAYMDIQQAINLEIFARFEKDGIEFAYPTQTLFMEPTKIKVG